MQTTTVSELYSVLDQSASLIKKQLHLSYLEALCVTSENIVNGPAGTAPQIHDRLKAIYAPLNRIDMTAEDMRRAFQFAILKGLKESPRPNQEMTPDTLVLLLGHMVSLLFQNRSFSMLDPAVGTGNLMTGIMNQVESDGVAAFGADTDDLLLKLAVAGSNLQQKEIRFFHQDGLKPLLIPPQDLVVCDVPVGIYPDEKRAKAFELGAIGERAYTHFLFIEQGLNALKEAGYLLYLIPNRLFQDDTDHLFYRYVQEHAYVLALLQLPHSLFRNQMAARSVLLMQKQGAGAEKPEQVLLAEVPSFSSLEGMRRFMQEMDDWFMHRLQFRQ